LCGATLQKFMSNPLVQAFFVGRAIAEVINERVEVALTDALSELGKFDAEAKEQLRQFTEEVMARANRAAQKHQQLEQLQITHLGEIHQTYRPKLTN
jgi:hypothetical protein